MRLAEPQDGHQGLVNAPLLFRVYPAYQFTEAPSVNGARLFNQDAGGLTEHVNFGRNDAGLALRDVGATRTAERGRNSLA